MKTTGWSATGSNRPDCELMMKAAESGAIQWILADEIHRFGFEDEWELASMVSQLRQARCKLYDANGKDWTGLSLMSFFEVGLAGHSSKEKQTKTSHDCLGGDGEPGEGGRVDGRTPKLGFDVACFKRNSAPEPKDWEEALRVVWEGRDLSARSSAVARNAPPTITSAGSRFTPAARVRLRR